MTYKANHIKILNIIVTFIVFSVCVYFFKYSYCQFFDKSKEDIREYHKAIFERSMAVYKAQISIPNDYKDADLISTSKIIKEAFTQPSLNGCKELWDIVFALGEKNLPYNNKILANSDISIEVITDKTCRFFLKNNNESLYFFDYALNM